MAEVSNTDIYNALLKMGGDIGRLEGKLDGHMASMAAHVEDDERVAEAVQKLQLSQARQRGFVAAISTVGAVAGATLGAAVDFLIRK
jgi:hypothetical protein